MNNNSTDNKYALLIGIDNYNSDSLQDLQLAKKDAMALYQYFTLSGGYNKDNVSILTDGDATKENIKNFINCFNSKITEDSTLVFFFAGHGTEYNSNFYLPLSNFNINNCDTYLTNNELIDLFSNVKANKVLFLFDTCHSGLLARNKDVNNNDNFLQKLVDTQVYNSRVLIASSLPDQYAWEDKKIENGIFTYCILKALKGACLSENSDNIRVFDLLKYLVKNVTAMASQRGLKQDCCIKTSLLYQDFIVCKSSKEVDFSTQLPTRYINAVIDFNEDNKALLDKLSECLLRREIDSKFTYWGEDVTKNYIKILNSKDYKLSQKTKSLLKKKIDLIIDSLTTIDKGIRVISLGIGDGHKDAIILNKICEKTNLPIDYWIIEFSYEMLKIGLNNVRNNLGEQNNKRVSPKLFQTDFLDIDILSDLLTDDKVNLFLLLGNTLGNFPEDLLLNKISSVMGNDDYFLIDNQIKGNNKLSQSERTELKKMYDTKEYREYILSILKNAKISEKDGIIKTEVYDDSNSPNATLRRYNCATVKQEFEFKVDKTVKIGGKSIPFSSDTIIQVIYSRKYSKPALNALLRKHFTVVNEPHYLEGKYALILLKKNKVNK